MFIFQSDKDNMYDDLLFVKRQIKDEEFIDLLNQLLSNKNQDLLPKEIAIRYIRQNNERGFLSKLELIQKEFLEIGDNPTQEIQIEPNKFRGGGVLLKDTYIVMSLNQTIEKLRKP